jgi:periodic tryptophan protein 2
MKFNYKLSRLCGACYGVPDATHSALAGGGVGGGGNVVYTSDGNSLISPMSNRI